jgi:hypothetical protein
MLDDSGEPTTTEHHAMAARVTRQIADLMSPPPRAGVYSEGARRPESRADLLPQPFSTGKRKRPAADRRPRA